MSISVRKPALTIALLLVISLALTACSAQSKASSQAALVPGKPIDVQITLSEFKVESSLTSFVRGKPYHFTITNEDNVPHEFRIISPVTGQKTTEEMDKMTLAMVGQDKLPARATATLDYTFTKPAPAGTLEFACHVPGHYEAGMKLAIVVK